MIHNLRPKLDKIETIRLQTYQYSMNLYENFFKICQNLRSLSIFSTARDDYNDEWMYHEYQNLEYLELLDSKPNPWSRSLEIFFHKNKQLKHFKIMHGFLLTNRQAIIYSKMKLDVLSIQCDNCSDLDEICIVLNELYDTGFYKRLQFHALRVQRGATISKAEIDKIATMKGLEKLSGFFESFNSTPIFGLKELHNLEYFQDLPNDFKFINISFPNLLRVRFRLTSINQLMQIVRYLPKLKELIADFREINSNPLNLIELNEERKKLAGACKVSIYIAEEYYLRTKKAANNLYNEHNLIEIKRLQAYTNSK